MGIVFEFGLSDVKIIRRGLELLAKTSADEGEKRQAHDLLAIHVEPGIRAHKEAGPRAGSVAFKTADSVPDVLRAPEMRTGAFPKTETRSTQPLPGGDDGFSSESTQIADDGKAGEKKPDDDKNPALSSGAGDEKPPV